MKYFLQNKIVWSTFVQFLGKIAQIGIGIISIKLVTRALGLEEYGLYGKISEYALFFATAANLGIFGNIVRKMSENPKDGQLFINALILRIVTAFLFFLAGTVYAWIWIREDQFFLGMLFFMSSLLLDYITSVCDGALQANYKMGRATLALLSGRIVNLLIILLIVALDVKSAPLFFLGPLTGASTAALISLFFVRGQLSFVWKLDKTLLKMLFFTALPFGVINIFNILYYRFLPSYFAAKILNETEYGSYNLSLHLVSTASLLSTLLMFSSLPILKQAIEQKEIKKVRDLLKVIKKSLFFLGIAVILGGSFIAPYAIQLISDKDFILPQLWFMLPLLLTLCAVSYFYDIALITLFAFEQDIWFLKREGLTLFIGLSLFLLSLLLPTAPLQMLCILCSAIIAEGTVTILGLRKINQLL